MWRLAVAPRWPCRGGRRRRDDRVRGDAGADGDGDRDAGADGAGRPDDHEPDGRRVGGHGRRRRAGRADRRAEPDADDRAALPGAKRRLERPPVRASGRRRRGAALPGRRRPVRVRRGGRLGRRGRDVRVHRDRGARRRRRPRPRPGARGARGPPGRPTPIVSGVRRSLPSSPACNLYVSAENRHAGLGSRHTLRVLPPLVRGAAAPARPRGPRRRGVADRPRRDTRGSDGRTRWWVFCPTDTCRPYR